MKKVISLSVMFALMVSMVNFVFADNDTTTFLDVPSDHWAYNEIQYFYRENIVDGIGNDKFAPDDNVTREQLAKLISIIYAKTDYQATAQTFCDVTPDMWSYNYIESVKEYLTGYYPADGQPFYNPKAYATREDVAYALVKVSGLDNSITADTSVLDNFKDNLQISYNLRKYIAIAVQSGLMVGYDGELNPQGGITRAETVTILFRAIKKPVANGDDEIIEQKPEVKEEVEEETKDDDKKGNNVSSGNYTNVIETNDIVRFTKVKDINTTGNIVFKWSSEEKIAEFTADLLVKESAFYAEKAAFKLNKLSYCSIDEIRGSFTLYRKGKVYEENIMGTVTAEDGILTFTTTDDEYVLVANYEDDIKNVSSLWDNEAYVYYDIDEFNGKDADGNCQLHYVRNKEFAEITYFKIESGEDVYVYEITDIVSVEEDEIEVIYTLKCNDEIIADNAKGKFIDYILKLGKYATFVSENGKYDVEMKIVEISE